VAAQLAEEQTAEPSPAVKGSNAFVAVVLEDPGLELGAGNQFDNLGKNGVLSHRARTSKENICELRNPQMPMEPGFFQFFRKLNRTGVMAEITEDKKILSFTGLETGVLYGDAVKKHLFLLFQIEAGLEATILDDEKEEKVELSVSQYLG
jgi:hypothetical protein